MRFNNALFAGLLFFANLVSCGRPDDKVDVTQTFGKFELLNNYTLSCLEFQYIYGKDPLLINFIQENCNNRKIVLLFAETVCPACIKIEIDNLNKTMNPTQVILVCVTESKRFLAILKRENDFTFPILQISGTTAVISQFLSNRPVYIFHNETPMPFLFLPDKNNNMLTMRYLNAIKMNFSE